MEQDLKSFLDDILFEGAIRTIFQPIVDLRTGEVSGYEALARGPLGSRLERPDLLFDAARSYGRVGDLDWACRATALRAALDAGLADPLTLFVNVEPDALSVPLPPNYQETWFKAKSDLRVILEVPERAITIRPADLFRRVQEMRELGWGLALDDVGADPRSLSMLPFLRPDIIKLDLSLMSQLPRSEIARVVHAAQAEVERRGAAILAEGIETKDQVELALTMGATFGQGWYFGRPVELPTEMPVSPTKISVAPMVDRSPADETPHEVLSDLKPTDVATKGMLLRISRHFENHAMTLREWPIVLATFQEERRFSDGTKDLYSSLANRAALVGVFATGMEPEPASGVRGSAILENDPLNKEWSVIVLSPHFSGAFTALDLGDNGPDSERRFEYAVTYNRATVINLALCLLARVLEVPV
jgi:EAL domain-containing protein (putative c-di-GMP-specific phosphodiesterase class I)